MSRGGKGQGEMGTMRTAIATWTARHQLAAYFLGAYAITWLLVSPLVASALHLISPPVSPAWHALGALGPILAALGVTAISGGRRGLTHLLRGMERWRIGLGWALIALLSPFAMIVLSSAILVLFGQPWPDLGAIASKFGDSTWLLVWFVGSAVYGVGEEPGWRGFALPRLQVRWSALAAAAILALGWGLWHAPFFFYRFEFGIGQAIGFFVGLLAGSIWLAYLYDATGGSVLATMSWHVTWNMANILAMLVSATLVSMLSAEVMIVAVVIAVVWKRGRRTPYARPARQEGPTMPLQRAAAPLTGEPAARR